MGKSIKKNALYNALLNVASVIFPLITAPYISRVLEPDGIGLFNFSNTYAGYFALVAMLGIPTYGVREVSKLRGNKVALTNLVSQLMTIASITTVIVTAIYLISISIIGQLSENYIIFLLAGFVIYFTPFKIIWYYQGIEEFGFITKVLLLVRTLSVICLFIFVRDKSDLIIYVILNILGSVSTDVWNFVKMWSMGIHPQFTFKDLKQHVKPLLILFTSSIAISIYTVLDTLMLGFINDYEEVGYYTNAMHVSKVILNAVTSLSIVAVPRISYYSKEKDYENINSLLNKSFSVVSFLAFPIAIGLSCVSPVFIPQFFGEKFVGSIVPLMILSMLIISIGMNNLTGVQILIGMGLDKLFLYSVMVGTISNFILNCFFIPLWGANGASVASFTAETFILFATIYFIYKNTPIRIDKWSDSFKSMIGALTFIPIIMLIQNVATGWWLIMVFVLLGSIVYLLIEIVLGNSAIYIFKVVIINKLHKDLQKIF